MSTTMAKNDTVVRKWYILDAAGKPLGKTAAIAADLLRGKHKVDFTPHVDCGDFVIILNAEKAVLTGKKLEQKYYRTHSGYPGGLKEIQYKHLMAKRPEFAMRLAVKGMLRRILWAGGRFAVSRFTGTGTQAPSPTAPGLGPLNKEVNYNGNISEQKPYCMEQAVKGFRGPRRFPGGTGKITINGRDMKIAGLEAQSHCPSASGAHRNRRS